MFIVKKTRAVLEITAQMQQVMQEIEQLESKYLTTLNVWVINSLLEEKLKELNALHKQLAAHYTAPKVDISLTQAAALAQLMNVTSPSV